MTRIILSLVHQYWRVTNHDRIMKHKTQLMDGKTSFRLTKHSNAGIVRIRKKTARVNFSGVSSTIDNEVTLIVV